MLEALRFHCRRFGLPKALEIKYRALDHFLRSDFPLKNGFIPWGIWESSAVAM